MTINVKIPEEMDSKFRFVLVAAHRAEQLMRGARPHEGLRSRKLTSIAQREVEGGLIQWEYTQPLADEVAAEEAAAEDEESAEELAAAAEDAEPEEAAEDEAEAAEDADEEEAVN